jgi:META domain-containing protein
MKPSVTSVPVFVATAALACLAAAGCGTVADGAPPNPAPGAQAAFTGWKWTVTAIDQAGRQTTVAERYGVGLQFAPDGEFGASDSVNYHSGTYHQADGGFTTSSLYTTAMGYIGKDPVVLLAVSAISAFDNGGRATAALNGDQLTVTIGGYTLIARRDGRQANSPTEIPTGASSSVAKSQ